MEMGYIDSRRLGNPYMETFAAGNICSYYYGIWETLSFLTENERVYIMINQAFSNHQQFNLIPKRPFI